MIQYEMNPKKAAKLHVAATRALGKAEDIRAKATERAAARQSALRAKDVANQARQVRHAATAARNAKRFAPTLEGRVIKGVGKFVKRHSGLISLLVAAPALANEIHRRMQQADLKRAAENYDWEEYALPKPGKPVTQLGDFPITGGNWTKASPKDIHGAVRNAVAQKVMKPLAARRMARQHGADLSRQKWAKMWRNMRKMRKMKRGASGLRNLYPYQLGRYNAYEWDEEYASLGGSRRTIAKLVGKAKRKKRFRKGVMTFPGRHPKTMMVAGGAGLGSWAMQKRDRNQQIGQSHYTYLEGRTLPVQPVSKLKKLPRAAWAATKKVGKPALRTGGKVALGGLISWIALSILQELEKKRLPAVGPYMPEVRPDIELARYTIGQVSANVAEIPTVKLYSLQSKTLETVAKIKGLPRKVKVGAEKGLLMWLLGFISAELVGRGITTPKRDVRVTGSVPTRPAAYSSRSMQTHSVTEWNAKNAAFNAETKRMVKGIKRGRRNAAVSGAVRKVKHHRGKIAAAALPWTMLAGIVAARKLRQQNEQKYFAAAAVGTAAKVAKAGKLATAGKWTNRAFTGWIAADLIGSVLPRKKKKGMTGAQVSPTYQAPQYY